MSKNNKGQQRGIQDMNLEICYETWSIEGKLASRYYHRAVIVAKKAGVVENGLSPKWGGLDRVMAFKELRREIEALAYALESPRHGGNWWRPEADVDSWRDDETLPVHEEPPPYRRSLPGRYRRKPLLPTMPSKCGERVSLGVEKDGCLDGRRRPQECAEKPTSGGRQDGWGEVGDFEQSGLVCWGL
jgi:hypothetical protein